MFLVTRSFSQNKTTTLIFLLFITRAVRKHTIAPQMMKNNEPVATKYLAFLKIFTLYSVIWASPRSIWCKGNANRITIKIQMNQMRNTQTKAFVFVFQARYLKPREMARHVFVIMESMETSFNIKKRRLRLQLMTARVHPLNQLAFHTMPTMKSVELVAALRTSTRARLATSIFCTVRSDLNRAMTARTKPLTSTETNARRLADTVIRTLVKNESAGCILTDLQPT